MANKISRRQTNLRTRAKIKDRKRRFKNKKRKYMIYYIFFIIIFLSTAITLSLTTFFKIENINIKISGFETEEKEILKKISLNYGDNLIAFDSEKAIKALLKSYPNLGYAEIIKQFPNTININCEFEDAVFFIENSNNNMINLIGISKSGRAVQIVNKKIDENYDDDVDSDLNLDDDNRLIVKINTNAFKPPLLGTFLKIPKEEQQILKILINTIKKYDLNNITQIEIKPNLEIEITHENRIKIEIKNNSRIEQMIMSAKQIIQDHIGQNEMGTIRYFEDDKTIHVIPKHIYD